MVRSKRRDWKTRLVSLMLHGGGLYLVDFPSLTTLGGFAKVGPAISLVVKLTVVLISIPMQRAELLSTTAFEG